MNPSEVVDKAYGDIKEKWLTNVRGISNRYVADEPIINHLNEDEQLHFMFFTSEATRETVIIEDTTGEHPDDQIQGKYLYWLLITDYAVLIVIGGILDPEDPQGRKYTDEYLYFPLYDISEIEYTEETTTERQYLPSSSKKFIQIRLKNGSVVHFPSPYDSANNPLDEEKWRSVKRYVDGYLQAYKMLDEVDRSVVSFDPSSEFDDEEKFDEIAGVHEELRSFAEEAHGKLLDDIERSNQDVVNLIEEIITTTVAEAQKAFEVEDYRKSASLADLTVSRLNSLQMRFPDIQDSIQTAHQLKIAAFALSGDVSEAEDAALMLANQETSYEFDEEEALYNSLQTMAIESREVTGEVVSGLLGSIQSHAYQQSITIVLGSLAKDYARVIPRTNVTAVVGLLKKDDPEIRANSCRILAANGKKRELDDLRDLTDDPDYDVRVASLRAMGKIAEREGVALREQDQERMQSVDVQFEGEGDVVVGNKEQKDVTTTVEDSVVNRSDIGGENDVEVTYCPQCGTDLEGFGELNFCPSCGQEL